MKKWIASVLLWLCLFGLAGCSSTRAANFTPSKPSITGVVQEVGDTFLLVENESGKYHVSLEAESKNSATNFTVGDEVAVYYDGNLAETYPMQIPCVYTITVLTPKGK